MGAALRCLACVKRHRIVAEIDPEELKRREKCKADVKTRFASAMAKLTASPDPALTGAEHDFHAVLHLMKRLSDAYVKDPALHPEQEDDAVLRDAYCRVHAELGYAKLVLIAEGLGRGDEASLHRFASPEQQDEARARALALRSRSDRLVLWVRSAVAPPGVPGPG